MDKPGMFSKNALPSPGKPRNGRMEKVQNPIIAVIADLIDAIPAPFPWARVWSVTGLRPLSLNAYYSLSKAYGLAHWRVGYLVAPGHLETPLYKVQDTILICPPVVSQHAALGAMEAGAAYCRQKLDGIEDVRNLILTGLDEINCFLHPFTQFRRVLFPVEA